MDLVEIERPEIEALERFVDEDTWEKLNQVGRAISLSRTIEAGGYEEVRGFRDTGIFEKPVSFVSHRIPKLAVSDGRLQRIHLLI